MKSKRGGYRVAVLLCLTVLVLSGCGTHASRAWRILGAIPSNNVNDYDLFVYGGTPYVAFNDPAHDLAVMKYDGAGWVAVGSSPPLTIGDAVYISLCVYDGMPYVAYEDQTAKRGYVQKLAGDGWVILGGGPFSAGDAYDISLSVYNNVPYVSYNDWNADNGITVRKFAGGAWQGVGAPNFAGTSVSYTSIDVSSGTPYVAFMGNNATVMKTDAGSATGWSAVGTALSPHRANNITMQVYNGVPYAAYNDEPDDFSSDWKLSVQKYRSGSNDWPYLGARGFATAFYPALSVDNGDVYVGFLAANPGQPVVLEYRDGAWTPVGEGGFTGISAWDFSLHVDGGTPYVAFDDASSGWALTVMAYKP